MRKNFGVKTYLYPQPVLIIGTYDVEGKANAMNAAWGGICDYDKVMLDLGEHKTTENMALTGAFTLSVGDAAHVAACDYVGIVSGSEEPDKVKKAGLTPVKSGFVNAPLFEEFPLALECEVLQTLPDGIYIGKIVNVSCDERFLGADGEPDLTKFTPIAFDPAHNRYLALGEPIADAFSVGETLK